MKQCFFFLATLLFTVGSFAAPQIKFLPTYGYWKSVSNWNPSRLPGNGDTILVPVNATLVVDDHQNLTNNNVYIKIFGTLRLSGSGKLNLGKGSVIVVHSSGTIKGEGTPSGFIKIGSSTVFSGNGATVTGSSMASSETGGQFESYSERPLPVHFLSFTVSRSSRGALVQWSTPREFNVGVFQIERSENGNSWTRVNQVTATGNTSPVIDYTFADNHSARLAYYRIRQVNAEGRYSYTPVRSVKNESGEAPQVLIAAAASQKIIVQFPEPVKEEVLVRLISLNGHVVSEQKIYQPAGQVLLNTDMLQKGNYIVSVSNGQDLKVARQIIF